MDLYILLAVFTPLLAQNQYTDCTTPIPGPEGKNYDLTALIGTEVSWADGSTLYKASICENKFKPCGMGCAEAGYCSSLLGNIKLDICYGGFGYVTPMPPPAQGLELVYNKFDYAAIGKVLIKCNPSATSPEKIEGINQGGAISFESVHGCVATKGLSGGSVFCIILLVLVVVYLAGGVAYNKYHAHKDGIELVPNLEYWTIFIELVQEGCQFTLQKVKEASQS